MKHSYNIKIIVAIFVFLGGIAAFSSCTKDYDHDTSPYYDSVLTLSLETIKGFYQGKDVQLDKDHDFQKVNISGIVISDASTGNIPEGLIFVQQGKNGIGIKLKDAGKSASFKLGDSVLANVSGSILTRENGNVLIKEVAASDISVLSSGKTPVINKVTLKTLANNFDRYNESLVQIYAAEIVPKPEAGDTYGGSKDLSDGSGEPGAIQLYTDEKSSLAGIPLEENATYTGIALYGSAGSDSLVKQIRIRNEDDIAASHLTPVNTPIIITGFLANPRGSDEKIKGETTEYSDGTIVTHKGGYEYIQLMALEDIDFSETPYSVVTCNNTSAKAGGWAAGGTTTYKFNLTKGFAPKGTFFYVGAASKVICAYWPTGLSTDISGANWIRTTQVYVGDVDVVTGDGFGLSINSFLGNSSSADGIAVFAGTDVTSTSVPLDAVFFNPPVGSALKDAYGYEVPDNEFYHREDTETGAPQHFFGQGSNTFAVKDAGKDNHFAVMGGMITAYGWLVPRNPTTIELDATSKLSDIESGPGITVYRK